MNKLGSFKEKNKNNIFFHIYIDLKSFYNKLGFDNMFILIGTTPLFVYAFKLLLFFVVLIMALPC